MCKLDGSKIEVDAEDLAVEVALNHSDVIERVMPAAGSLLILAWETTEAFHDIDPLWEFLRHCRNAAAHNGRFRLLGKEPSRLAKWGSSAITKALHETSLFGSANDGGLFGPGDPIRLLWDIEQAYPALAV